MRVYLGRETGPHFCLRDLSELHHTAPSRRIAAMADLLERRRRVVLDEEIPLIRAFDEEEEAEDEGWEEEEWDEEDDDWDDDEEWDDDEDWDEDEWEDDEEWEEEVEFDEEQEMS